MDQRSIDPGVDGSKGRYIKVSVVPRVDGLGLGLGLSEVTVRFGKG